MLHALGILIDEGVIATIHACCQWVDMSNVFILCSVYIALHGHVLAVGALICMCSVIL